MKGSPQIQIEGETLTIKTHQEAGGVAYLLDQPVPLGQKDLKLDWKWRVSQFPQTFKATWEKMPTQKDDEDFALRVGVLLSDGVAQMPLPRKFSRELRKRRQKLSYVVFYCATPKMPKGVKCVKSPFNRQVVNCARSAGSQYQKVEVSPLQEAMEMFQLSSERRKNLTVLGFWLFADSDNSNSKSSAQITSMRMMY